MHPFLEEFVRHLDEENREKCVDFVLSKLDSKEIDVVTLFTEVLTPALNEMKKEGPEEEFIWKEHIKSSIVRTVVEFIWKEHIKSSIVRTVVECCYRYVIKEKKARFGDDSGLKAMVLCPPEEQHEIGARMVADFFTLAGYDVTFVGANTPRDSFLSAIKIKQPRYVAISISNFYNILAAKKTIESIRVAAPEDVIIVVGGSAFASHPEAFKDVGADRLLRTYEDITKLEGGG
jgi:methanogenic corrinoid protein MtbC1